MRWMVMGLLLVGPAMGAGEGEQWYDYQGKPVEVSPGVATQRTEAEWVPGWLAEERARQAQLGKKRWSYDRGWYGYGWANGRYWFRAGYPRTQFCRPYRWGGYYYRSGSSNRWGVRVNTPGLQINWCR